MNPSRTTYGILLGAALCVAGTFFLSFGRGSAAAVSTAQQQDPGGLTLNAYLASSHILKGQSTSHLAIQLRAPDTVANERPPVDVAIVLDRSGSMEGEKLLQAKLAAMELVGNLQEGDSLSLTAYGSEAEVLLTTTEVNDNTKEFAASIIEGIYTDGGTNLSDGLVAGYEQLRTAERGLRRVRRVVLISDGQATEGIVDKAALARLAETLGHDGATLSTLGLGLDFDEQTMTALAVSGGGNYYFAASAQELPALFRTEISRLGSTFATHVELRITPRSPERVHIAQVIGFTSEQEGPTHVLRISDLHAGETRKVIAEFGANMRHEGVESMFDIEVRYVVAKDGSRKQQQAQLSATITDSPALVLEHRNREANRLIGRALTAEAIDEATNLYEQGDSRGAEAVIEAQQAWNLEVAAELDDADFEEEMKASTERAQKNLRAAPAGSAGGKKASKGNRYDSYHLKY